MSYSLPIYHICNYDEWKIAKTTKIYSGSSQDKIDGFIHFSAGDQIMESAAKHRAGQDNLVLLEVDPTTLGATLKWEESRNGNKFPHLYGDLSIHLVKRSCHLNLGPDGYHIFPEDWDIK